jgi:hypothetical protein
MMDYWKSLHRNRRRHEVPVTFEKTDLSGIEGDLRYVMVRLDKIEARLDKVEKFLIGQEDADRNLEDMYEQTNLREEVLDIVECGFYVFATPLHLKRG